MCGVFNGFIVLRKAADSLEAILPDIVNAVLLREGKVLLARRSSTRKAYADRWSFPGGHVEVGESREQALRRELDEEVGIVPTLYRALAEIEDPHTTTRTTYHLYAVTRWEGGEPAIRDHEHSELRWFALLAACSLDQLALEAYRPLFAKLMEKRAPL